MLRFDLPPVWSNVTRWEAFVSFLVSGASLLFTPWLMGILVVQGLVRGFFGHYKCPAHRIWVRLFESRGWGGKKENAGAKIQDVCEQSALRGQPGLGGGIRTRQ